MNNLSLEQKQKIMDAFGEIVISNVRDNSLKISMDIVKRTTKNQIKLQQYDKLDDLSSEEQEQICDLISETVTDVIYRFLELFEENSDNMKLLYNYNGTDYDLTNVSEKMGNEIACFEDTGWIQKFSKLGRFVLWEQ